MTSTAPSPGRAASRPGGERSRGRILDAAEKLLVERGYAGTGISAISRASGLPASSIYWFFENKQDLTAAVIERSAERWLNELGESHLEGNPESRLQRLFGRAMDQSNAEMPVFLRLAILLSLELGDRDPQILDRLQDLRARGTGLVRDALEGVLGEIDGGLPDRLLDQLAPLTSAFAEGALLVAHLDEKIDLDQVSEDLEVAMRAVALNRLQKEAR